MNYKVVDMFSGCGGLSYGFHTHSEYEVIAAFDTDKHSNATYEKNFGLSPNDGDIGTLEASDVSATLPNEDKKGLIFVGGPPCQGFSSHRKKDPRKDERNSLVKKYAELACALSADAVVIENVPDLFAKKHWHHYHSTLSFLEESGYSVASGIINMAQFGVPQERFRALIIAFKSGVPCLPCGSYSREQFVTVRDAISHLPQLSPGGICARDPMHVTSRHRKETVETIKKVPLDGGSRPKGVGPKCLDKVKGFYDVYGRLYWDKPAVTITARCRTPSCGRFVHPEQHRGLSVREAALLQGFPEDFDFDGPFDDKFKQIGNAVPPLFSSALAEHLVDMLGNARSLEMNSPEAIRTPITNSFSTLIGTLKKKDGVVSEFL